MILATGLLLVGVILGVIVRSLRAKARDVIKLGLCLSLLVVPAQAQSLEGTYAQGRFYNIVTGAWTHAFVPGVEMCVPTKAADVTATFTAWFDRDGYFEHDYALAVSREFKRLTVSLTTARYEFKLLEPDTVWFIETRWLIFGKH